MANSGEILDLSDISNNIVDKHSTGGIGDKVTVILMPIIASLGIKVAKLSGRGLGITGGTADKLDSIPGYRTGISIKEFKQNVKDINISLVTQTLDVAPADKKIYALRDVINCIDSIPLIASSIMSKKIALGANKIVLDVMCGSGAFMKNIEEAESLAKLMVKIGEQSGKETVCLITNMNQPLGYSIGNNLEIIEAIKFLKGDMPEDLKEVVLESGSYIIKLATGNDDLEEHKKKMLENIENGKAYNKFLELVKRQSGDISVIENTNLFPKANCIIPYIAEESGYVSKIDAEKIGLASLYLGAGRMKKEDSVDFSAGIVLNKKIEDTVEKGEVLAYIHANNEQIAQKGIQYVMHAFEFSNEKVERQKEILKVI